MTDETARRPLTATAGKETILVAEDEHIIRMMLREVLTIQGYTVLDTGRGAEALVLAEKSDKPVDLLVTDMSMPGMNGWDLAKNLRQVIPGLPVMFISGHNDHETMQWGKMDQPLAHLHKPFTLEAFLTKARDLLDAGRTIPAAAPPALP